MQILSTVFSFGIINSSIGELGCLIRIISSLVITVQGSTCGLTMDGDPRLDVIHIQPQLT